MATKIEWTDEVWNPVVGCTKVSQGCKHCYAERIYERFNPGKKFTEVKLREWKLEDPLHWRKPRRVFVNSMSDLFHEQVDDVFIAKVFAVMALTPQHTYQILTKRPERMQALLSAFAGPFRQTMYINLARKGIYKYAWPLPNVWLGVSVEDQEAADERIPLLVKTPAAIRFVSCEPLLGEVELGEGLGSRYDYRPTYDFYPPEIRGDGKPILIKAGIDWVIVGGESGPGARPMHPNWVRRLRDQCEDNEVPFFFKQWGEWLFENQLMGSGFQELPKVKELRTVGGFSYYRVGKKAAGRRLDGVEWNTYPQPLPKGRGE